MSVVSRSLVAFSDKYFRKILDDEDVTEVCYNGGKYIYSLNNLGEWTTHKTELSSEEALNVSTTLSSLKGSEVGERKPILSAILDRGERVQIVVYPATKKGISSITIRKPSYFKISMDKYEEQKLFEVVSRKEYKKDGILELYKQGRYREFIEEAVVQGKTIIVSGATGSGKTTFMKTLIDFIPASERIITIEDVEELVFTEHKNYVQLFYPSEAKSTDFLNSTTLLKSCLRMKPTRIILAELRGAETHDFINIINSGHSGSITSCHAGSVAETFRRLELMTLQHKSGQMIPFHVIRETLEDTIDIVIHMADTKIGRRITEVYYKEHELSKKKKEVTV